MPSYLSPRSSDLGHGSYQDVVSVRQTIGVGCIERLFPELTLGKSILSRRPCKDSRWKMILSLHVFCNQSWWNYDCGNVDVNMGGSWLCLFRLWKKGCIFIFLDQN